jgi:Cutinase
MSRHVILTVAGTGSDMFNTASPQPALVGSNMAAADPENYFWQPVGDYPAATFPMQPSVTDGVNSLIYLTTGTTVPGDTNTTVPGPNYPQNGLILMGYSQGALVVCQFIQWCWANNRIDILERIVAVVVWGNPQRLEGFASGNEFAGWPMPADRDGVPTCGIAQTVNVNGPANMTMEQMQPISKTVTHYWADFVNTNTPDLGETELYANAPSGGVGSVEQSIFNAVETFDLPTVMGVLADLDMLGDIGLAIINGFEFLGAGGAADHYTYDVTPMQTFATLAGSETPPFGPF